MTKNDDKCVPALRFKGFNNDWAQRKLGEISIVNSGKDYKQLNKGNIPVYGTGGYMLSVDQYLSKNDAVGIGRKGTIDHPQYLKAPFWTVDTLFFMTVRENNNLHYLYSLFQKINWKKYDESTGLPSLSKKTINNISVKVPEYIEQKRIGNFISQVDSLLSLQQRKLQQLKLLKKAMLQDLFTDKKVPKLRFSGFKENWIQCKLGEIVKVIGGGTPSTKNPKYWNGQINWYSPNEIGSSIFVNSSKKKITSEGLKHSSAKLLPGNKTILFTSRAGIGDMAIMTSDGTTNQGFQSWIVDSKDTDIYFLYTLGFKLKRQSLRKASGSTFLEISNSEVKQLKLTVPSIEEQELIGLIVQKMDRLIVIQQKEFNKLESLKKFLLQNMFI